MKETRHSLGSLGELIARDYLRNKGYKIIAQNYRTKYAEIDLIVRHKKILIFVEVRTKTSEQFGTPEESLNQRKINRLIKIAAAYTLLHSYTHAYRIDAICILFDKKKQLQRIGHYQNITFLKRALT